MTTKIWSQNLRTDKILKNLLEVRKFSENYTQTYSGQIKSLSKSLMFNLYSKE